MIKIPRMFRRTKAKVLELNFNPIKTLKVKSHKVIKIGNQFFYRKDQVEAIIAEVINKKVAAGELKKVQSSKFKVQSSKKKSNESNNK